jgi:hypothetical protein
MPKTALEGTAMPFADPLTRHPTITTTTYATYTTRQPAPMPGHGQGSTYLPALVLLAAVVFGVIYWGSLHLHPLTSCRECGGSGRHHGAVYHRAFRPCRKCRGTGRKLRYGTRFLRSSR